MGSMYTKFPPVFEHWNVANVQQTDTVQQFLAYEKCYLLTGTPTDKTPQGCIAAHERLSYSADYPITKFWWNLFDTGGTKLNCSRAAELTLANSENSHMPGTPDQTKCAMAPVTPQKQPLRFLSKPDPSAARHWSQSANPAPVRPSNCRAATDSSLPGG